VNHSVLYVLQHELVSRGLDTFDHPGRLVS
jgi:hypothetical protein